MKSFLDAFEITPTLRKFEDDLVKSELTSELLTPIHKFSDRTSEYEMQLRIFTRYRVGDLRDEQRHVLQDKESLFRFVYKDVNEAIHELECAILDRDIDSIFKRIDKLKRLTQSPFND